jgi:hypothetical protein
MKHWGRGGENSGVPTPEGDGYIGTLNVYHELHCLKRIHQSMYPEYYWPEYDEHQLEMVRLHNGIVVLFGDKAYSVLTRML